ncbi:DUF924 family protein [Gymnodinialimonas ulvae]|uniref:DUF924 family protein n=1 Tax=Gymnodinialimonas ulvae TaxID=3126504 RepID=UPI003099AB4A
MTQASEVVAFWEKAGPAAWYKQDDAFDQAIRDRFGETWQAAHDTGLREWAVDAPGALGLVILLDQFPRNMFRNDPRAFATDAAARDVSGQMIANGWDRKIDGPLRQFAYMPFMHSEDIAHQEVSVDLFETRMDEGNNDLHARAHREIIRRFGRFPYRNAALGREMTAKEQAFVDDGGYGHILRALEGT